MYVNELNSTIFDIVKHRFWRDIRHRQTFAWMVTALIVLKSININLILTLFVVTVCDNFSDAKEGVIKLKMRVLNNDGNNQNGVTNERTYLRKVCLVRDTSSSATESVRIREIAINSALTNLTSIGVEALRVEMAIPLVAT